MKFLFLSILVFLNSKMALAQTLNQLCLRHPAVSVENFKERSQGCSYELAQLANLMADPGLDLALEKATQKIEAQPHFRNKIWTQFLRQLKTKIWTPRHAQVAQEIELQIKGKTTNPTQEGVADNPGSLASRKGWEDIQILRDGDPVSQLSSDPGINHHWMAYSSVWAPVIFWGTAADFAAILSKSAETHQTSWIQNDCKAEKLLDARLLNLKNALIVPILPTHCKTGQADFYTVTSEKERLIQSPGSGTFTKDSVVFRTLGGAIGIAVLAIVVHGLKDKKLVIKR